MIWRKGQPKTAQHDEGPRGFDDFELKLGDILRGERATLGKSLLDVQRELHIRAAHIAAIENGDLGAFETPGFIAGFVRSYARYLGMDPEWVYGRFCAEHGFQVAHGMSGFASAAPRPVRADLGGPLSAGGALRGVGLLPDPDPFWKRIEPGALGSVTVLVALILGLGFAGWTVLREVQRVQIAPADVSPTVASDINPLVPLANGSSLTGVETDPLATAVGATPAPTVTAALPQPEGADVRMARPQALEVPILVPRDGPIAAIEPPATVSADQTDAAVAAALAATATPVEGPQVVDQGPARVQILAVRPAWVRVRGADGTIAFERVLDAGETYDIPATELPHTLHAGNSGSVYFLIDGQAFGPAAPGAQVVRNVSLAVADLTASYAAATPGADADLDTHVASLREP